MVKPITEIVIENGLMNKRPSICREKELKQKYENIQFLLYCDSDKLLPNYLNIIFEKQPFEHIFLTFRAGIDYKKNSLKILNLKWRVFLFFKRRNMEKKISTKADVYISKKQTRSYSFHKTNFLLRLLWQNSRVYFKRMGKKEIFFRGVWTYLFEADIVMTVLQVFSHGTAKYFLNLKLIKECSSYHYHYILISTDRHTNEKHWRDLFLSSHPRVFL